MKKFISHLFFFLPILLFSQQSNNPLRITYELSFQIDSLDQSSVDTEYMYLDVDDKVSVFRSQTTHLKDSILSSKNPRALFGIQKSKFRYKIYKDRKNDELICLYDFTTFKYKTENKLPQLVWKIENSKKNIMGYETTLARTHFKGRDYEAWFAPNLPVPEGPYKFNGLPGMILEVYDSKNHYHFTAKGIEKIKVSVNVADQDYTRISDANLDLFRKKIKEKPSLILNNPGIHIPKEGLDKYDRNQRARLKNQNNPIELE
ncbi:GLPGLI family protein [Christiangramia sp. OXR-203]|jgi:GLPGLI family protein|uniref:GLPGLI family protein n=1 Tax=Christiangramia sp. OXR-203 TaxID=3100176 RepID=UPI002AC9D368|nr:GLPGLI family protein [Christiangramia sp. OXR-203]WPY97673.1 GLPGLI family protein [Christiangramia sp. OXR-203]